MSDALERARSVAGTTRPNPAVGAVLVKDDRAIAHGATEPPGGRHAEIVALDAAGDAARGSTLYVTLEPCCHAAKRTPPCVPRIVAAGVAHVVIAARDENPSVRGQGASQLRAAGIAVDAGVLEEQARELYAAFFRWIATGMPLVTLKVAMTLDGKMTWGDGKRKQVTGSEAQRYVHELRASHDAILVGVGTVVLDDPQLTVRDVPGVSPVRVVLDPALQLPVDAKILHQPGETLILTSARARAAVRARLAQSATIVAVDESDGMLEPRSVLKALGDRAITSVLVEGGVRVAQAFLRAGVVDRAALLLAPFSVGEGRGVFDVDGVSLRIREPRMRALGDDMLIEGYVER
jgi:diaminohydroxyphosphoribosylaminopyrimidine deaminase/5-amino-6-(5-phosphoribosylamino)uracil reductase